MSDSAYFNLAANHMDGWIVFSEGAVFGYDNTSQARNSSPGLSSMHQNILDIGIAAAETLLLVLIFVLLIWCITCFISVTFAEADNGNNQASDNCYDSSNIIYDLAKRTVCIQIPEV